MTAWDVFAEFNEKTIWDCPVEFTNVSVYQPVQVERTEKVVLGVLFDYKSQFSVSFCFWLLSHPLWLNTYLLTGKQPFHVLYALSKEVECLTRVGMTMFASPECS